MAFARTKKADIDPTAVGLGDILKKACPHAYGPQPPLDYVSTGVDLLDWHLGGRGFPCGRVHEVHGCEGSGKTTLALQCARSVQAQGGEVVYMDTESGLDLGLCVLLGVDPAKMHICTPFWLEEVHDLIEKVVANRENATTPTLLVWDCVAQSFVRAASDGKVGEYGALGAEARENAHFFGRPWMAKLKNSRICVLMANQPRDKIGQMFGPKTGTPGGRILRHACCIRMELTKGQKIQDFGSTNIVGHRVVAEIIKNKTTGRELTVELSAYLDRGIDNLMSSFHYVFDEKKDSAGRITWQDKSWYRPQLFKHLQESPESIEQFRTFAREVFLGKA